MFSQRHRLIALSLAVAVIFTAGLIRLFLLRFEAGDVYPAYSSLRTDPLGTRVLFESLNRLAENSALRNFSSPDQISPADQTTLLFCGLWDRGYFLESRKVKTLMDHVAASGGRLVLTFSSRLRKRSVEAQDHEAVPDGNCTQTSEPGEASTDESQQEVVEEWHGAASLGFGFKQNREKEMDDTAFRAGADNDHLPAVIPWRTTMSFEVEDEAWQTLYVWQGQPVVLQRQWGRGSVVVSADSYLFSNEAMRNHRLADWLVWMIGPGNRVVFDEFHNGLTHRQGIASLARRYRLHGVFGALLVVAILFIWRQAAVFVPAQRDRGESTEPAAGRITGQGLVDLARRHIQAKELLTICFNAWKTHGIQRTPEAVVTQIRGLIRQSEADPGQNTPVVVYRRICELLKQGKGT